MKNVLDIERAEIMVPAGRVELTADLSLPDRATGLVIFAHGSGSSRRSPRNRRVAGMLNQGAIATILVDLLTEQEEAVDLRTAELRFDIDLLVRRLTAITEWAGGQPDLQSLRIGYFGASTGAAAALGAAAECPHTVRAVVSRGGRPDLAGAALGRVLAPCLFIVGGDDPVVLRLNREAIADLPRKTEWQLEIIPRATHLFEEPGALDRVANLALDWFQKHLKAGSPPAEGNMTLAQVAFRNMDTAPELEAAVQKETSGLDRFFNRIMSCRVVIEGPRRQEYGGLYNIRIDVGVPGEELVVEHNPTLHTGLQEIEAMRKTKQSEPHRERRDARRAIHEAFKEMRRRLQDYARRMRGDTKQHERLALGTVTKLSPEEGFGFLEADGHGVYFHRNSVLAGHFDRLRIGSRVRFAEEVGEKGPQASSVRLVRSTRQGRNAAGSALLPQESRGGAAS